MYSNRLEGRDIVSLPSPPYNTTMYIFHDPTEQRNNTRLPLLKNSIALSNLERLTGADMLLSPLEDMDIDSLDSALGVAKLKAHCAAGVLVQRKSGSDLLSSIDRLPNIQYRMLQWGLPWLLVTGDIKCSRSGKCVIDGRESGFSYWSVIGALDYWQLRGGGITILCRDNLIVKWINDMSNRIKEVDKNPEHGVETRGRQTLVLSSSKAEGAMVLTLSTIPNIGVQTARNIARKYDRLAVALAELSDKRIVKSKEKPVGVGKGTVSAFRKWMGLKDNEVFTVIRKSEYRKEPS